MPDHESLEAAVAAFVLGAADPDEAGALRAHIEGCPSCRLLAVRLGRAVAVLPLATDIVAPPARLRERILAAASASAPAAGESPRRSVIRLEPPRSTFWQRLRLPAPAPRLGAYAAVALAILGLGTWNLALTHDLSARPLPGAPGQVARYTLTGTATMAAARATVVDLRSDGVTLVDFKGLPQPEYGKVYEIWLVTADKVAVPAAVFTPDQDGSKVVVLTRPLAGFRAMAITAEPGPAGSKTPTDTPQLQGPLV